MYKRFIRRLVDIFFSFAGFVFLLIPALLIAFLVAITSKVPIFFIQQRFGYKASVFLFFKFRTVSQCIQTSNEQVFHDHPEVILFGRFLRCFKLDEFPKLINILVGYISFIGPPPFLPNLQEKFDENIKRRLETRTGLFGLADISGGYYLT